MMLPIPTIVQQDSYLMPYIDEIRERIYRYKGIKAVIEQNFGSLLQFAQAHLYFGFHYDTAKDCWYYREYAPSAAQLWLTGDFNGWNRTSHPLERKEQGIWEIQLQGKNALTHGSKVKVVVDSRIGLYDRIPTYATRVVQEENSVNFSAEIWQPEKPYQWKNKKIDKSNFTPLIYEAHVGMAQEYEGVGSYTEFTENILPRIQAAGYNTIQLMAIQEHPYYGSFGYHVANFFAVTSRFGTPNELKTLIDTAHGMGIAVIMDLVHSHAVKNIYEGLNLFDGSDYFFRHGAEGDHPLWDSKIFDYKKLEVIQFLLSNVQYWLTEFQFDGFRFDGVTSMLYHHHGFAATFNSYDDYFGLHTDKDSILYLQLANEVAHNIDKNVLCIAEDVSGMPGLCRPIEEGGIGFDYRLSMGLPDFWIKTVQKRDEDWRVGDMWHALLNRRQLEKHIAYVESHDQALVGDKTIAFWLMDKEMYFGMSKKDESLVIDRGIALHKMIRLITIVLGGEGYLNFMGNEFGHPEWIDFPGAHNNWSYKHARRIWSIADDKKLRFHYLSDFDRDMIAFVKKHELLQVGAAAHLLNIDDYNQAIAFEKKGLVFVFCFHPTRSVYNYLLWVSQHGKYQIIFCSDDEKYGGHQRIDTETLHFTNEQQQLSLYVTNRTAFVLKKID